MQQYLDLVESVLQNGSIEENRTDEYTIADFGMSYQVDLSAGYPLLTTKKMDTFRWDSMLHEVEWYLSGEHHIRSLTEKTGIWDAWADNELNLPSAYGRFWRRYPVPGTDGQLAGETWISEDSPYTTREDDGLVLDQLQFIVDALNGENPHRGPESRRLVMNAWHPSNAYVSDLPPCHFTAVFNVQDGRLNLHLTQRSADIALGVPFNIAAYSLLNRLVAQETGYESGVFSHTLVDAHVYCGQADRAQWYSENINHVQTRLNTATTPEDYRELRDDILTEAPTDTGGAEPSSHKYGHDHVPGLLEQLAREPYGRSTLALDDDATINTFDASKVDLRDYKSHGGLRFAVAE